MDTSWLMTQLTEWLNDREDVDNASAIDGEPNTIGISSTDGEIWFLTLSGE